MLANPFGVVYCICMPLLPATLAKALTAIDLYGDEIQTIQAWTGAWMKYISQAQGGGIPANYKALAAPRKAMESALVGMSVPNAGPGKIQAGIVAFWSSMVSATSAVFSGTIPPLTPPPGIGGIGSAIQSVANTNTAGNLTKYQAYLNLANAIHPQNLGGLVTMPGSPPYTAPIT